MILNCKWGEKLKLKNSKNPHLKSILDELKCTSNDAYLWYLRGVVAIGLGLEDEAMDAFIQSILLDSWNWCAWLELSNLVSSLEQVIELINT